MALKAYLRLKGSVQGEIKGSVTQKGREGRIEVLASNHQVARAPDGKGQLHPPFELLKPLDQASTKLYQAWVANEAFSDCEIQYWAPKASAVAGSAAGVEVQVYTVKLTQARLSQIDFEQPNTLDADALRWPICETLQFSYERIEWLWTATGHSVVADAGAPKRLRPKKA